jgi:hypothetical protein
LLWDAGFFEVLLWDAGIFGALLFDAGIFGALFFDAGFFGALFFDAGFFDFLLMVSPVREARLVSRASFRCAAVFPSVEEIIDDVVYNFEVETLSPQQIRNAARCFFIHSPIAGPAQR